MRRGRPRTQRSGHAAAHRRELDAVLVWKLDRWGRSVADLVTTLHELSALGVAFVSMTEAIDLSTPSGRALATMLAAFADAEPPGDLRLGEAPVDGGNARVGTLKLLSRAGRGDL